MTEQRNRTSAETGAQEDARAIAEQTRIEAGLRDTLRLLQQHDPSAAAQLQDNLRTMTPEEAINMRDNIIENVRTLIPGGTPKGEVERIAGRVAASMINGSLRDVLAEPEAPTPAFEPVSSQPGLPARASVGRERQ